MKKLLFLAIFSLAFSLAASNDELRKAIIASDIAKVKKILSTSSLSIEEKSIFSSMAQNIIIRRRENELIAYTPQIVIGVPGALISLIALTPVLGSLSAISEKYMGQKETHTYKELFMVLLCGSIAELGGLSLLYATYKIYTLTHKWHDNAIEIREIIESQKLITNID